MVSGPDLGTGRGQAGFATASAPTGVDTVSGTRAWDMALRLDYDEVAVREVVPGLGDALRRFVAGAGDRPMRVFCTYTSMLELRRELSRVAEVAEI